MKNIYLMILSIALSLSLCGFGSCKHVHNDECGPNGINCKHECYQVKPREDEHTDL